MASPKRGAKLLSQEAQDKVRKILDDPDYEAMLALRAKQGRLPAPLEITLWHYRYGVPTIPVEVKQDLSELSDAELAQRAAEIALKAREAASKASEALDAASEDGASFQVKPPSGRTH